MLVLALFLSLPLRAQTSPLLGTWEEIRRSAGGVGTIWTFDPDNSFTHTVGTLFDFRFRRALDSLYVIDTSGNETPTHIAISGDTMISSRPGTLHREIRISKRSADDPLVGTWTYPFNTQLQAYEEYLPSGELHVRAPISTAKGFYTALGDSAWIVFPDPGGDRLVHFFVKADTLLLDWEGESRRYLRAHPR